MKDPKKFVDELLKTNSKDIKGVIDALFEAEKKKESKEKEDK